MKRSFLFLVVTMAGCTGSVHSPPVVLVPILLPIAIVEKMKGRRPPAVYQSVPSGDTAENPIVLALSFTSEDDLHSYLGYYFWVHHDYRIPGEARGYFVVSTTPRKIEGVVFRDAASGTDRTYFFDLTDSAVKSQKPNKALEPTPTSVTSPAAQEPRQP